MHIKAQYNKAPDPSDCLYVVRFAQAIVALCGVCFSFVHRTVSGVFKRKTFLLLLASSFMFLPVGALLLIIVNTVYALTSSPPERPSTTTQEFSTQTLPETIVGPFKVGDTGPGGGIVFFVSCVAELETTCTYLEAAPNGWNGSDEDPRAEWLGSVWFFESRPDQAQYTGIGFGYQNTAWAASHNFTADRAITLADSYVNNGKADWFLPSLDELNELCKYARQQTTGDTSVACNDSGSLRNGFADDYYWSSSAGCAFGTCTSAWYQYFDNGNQNLDRISGTREGNNRVRPVRTFLEIYTPDHAK